MSIKPIYLRFQNDEGKHSQNVVCSCSINTIFAYEIAEYTANQFQATEYAIEFGLWRKAAI
jgi:hypothetical protein